MRESHALGSLRDVVTLLVAVVNETGRAFGEPHDINRGASSAAPCLPFLQQLGRDLRVGKKLARRSLQMAYDRRVEVDLVLQTVVQASQKLGNVIPLPSRGAGTLPPLRPPGFGHWVPHGRWVGRTATYSLEIVRPEMAT